MKEKLIQFAVLVLLAIMLTLSGCVKNTNGIPCETVSLIYYEDIKPLEAEIEVLKNNAVIEEICQ